MEVQGEVCEPEIRASGVLSASPAAGAGRHTWQCARATQADVSLVSQLCVCVCLTHPYTLWKKATCVITPHHRHPLPMGISV